MKIKDTLKKISPYYLLRPRGKNLKFVYYSRCWLRNFVPYSYLKRKKEKLLEGWESREDAEYIRDRVNYYNKNNSKFYFTDDYRDDNRIKKVSEIVNGKTVYYRDAFEILRYFPKDLLFRNAFGDNRVNHKIPSVCKSRPITEDSTSCVLLNLDKVRHFVFLKDKLDFEKKRNAAIFRGACNKKKNRILFMEKFFTNPSVDCADTGRESPNIPEEWRKGLITLYDHLKFKFIISLEGNDVASNLKWVMSSNSIAIMPKPKYETWFMEGRLIPDYHYIMIKEDYSDLLEKMDYYINHPDAARKISRNANEWCRQFYDSDRELLISLLVMEKYFSCAERK